MVAGVLIERQSRSQYAAARIRNMHHLQVALQQTILARSAMNSHIRIVKIHQTAQGLQVASM